MAEVLEQSRDREKAWSKDMAAGPFQSSSLSGQHTEEKAAMGALESALAAAEEDLDVQAAKTAKAEAVADLAEFDENIPLEEADKDDAQVSKAEQEVQNLIAQVGQTFFEISFAKLVTLSLFSFSLCLLYYLSRLITCHVIFNVLRLMVLSNLYLADSNRTVCHEVCRRVRRCVLRSTTGCSRTGTGGTEERVGVGPVAGTARGGGTTHAAGRRRRKATDIWPRGCAESG